MRIRAAEEGDIAAIEEIVERAYSPFEELIGRRPQPLDDDYAKKVGQLPVYVADDGVVAGVLVLAPEADHLLLENVAVDPERQGEGIGRALLDRAEEAALELGYSKVRLYTNVAMSRNIEMYRRRGYRIEERRHADGFDRVFFVKAL